MGLIIEDLITKALNVSRLKIPNLFLICRGYANHDDNPTPDTLCDTQ